MELRQHWLSPDSTTGAHIELLEEPTRGPRVRLCWQLRCFGAQRILLYEPRYRRRVDSKAKSIALLERQDVKETDSDAEEWFCDTEATECEKRLT